MFLDMSTHTKNIFVIVAIFWCCVVPRFECCNPGKKMTLEEKVDGSNIVLLGTVLAHYAENRTDMFTAVIQVKCVLKDEGFFVHNIINVSRAGKDSGGQCFDTALAINNTYYLFIRILTANFLVPATEEIPEKSPEAIQLLNTCGLSGAKGPGLVNACNSMTSMPCPTTTPQPPSTRRVKPLKTTGTTATVVQVTSASASSNKGTTATVVQVTSASASNNKDDKVESKDSNVGAILGGVLGTLAAGGVAGTIYFFVKNKMNKKVSITEPHKDKILEDEDLSEISMSKPPMVTEAIEKF